MAEGKIFSKNTYCYITWFVTIIFSVLMMAMSGTCRWGIWIQVYVAVTMLLVSFATFYRKSNEKIQSYFIVYISMADCIIYSYMQRELYPTLIVVCSLSVMLAIYMNFKLLIPVAVLSVCLVGFHLFVLESVVIETTEDAMRFCIRIVTLMFSEFFIMAFVHRLRKTEERLKASLEKAKSAEQSKSEFLANMSHEIRTPMNVIVGMCELILRDNITEEVRENCFNIQNSGRSLLAIINDILDFSKIESGKMELVEQEFNIGSTINDVMNMATTRKADKNLELIVKIDPSIPKGLIGDEVRIKQVIINLVTNAIKFTKSGCVVIKVSQSKHDYGINLKVTVADTGIGISDENLERIFTSFQQVDTKKNRSVEGTGLGLAISKRLISKMGGFINVSSTYGRGSEFKFVIPLKVSDKSPFIHIKDTSKVKIAVYVDMHKFSHPRVSKEYGLLIQDMSEKFGTSIVVFDRFNELKKELEFDNSYTHCFVAKEEFLANEEYFIANADKLKILLIQDRLDAIIPDKKIKIMYKPFYALSVASVLNNEKYVFNFDDKKNYSVGFTAENAKVLVVDDNINNLKVVEGLMKPYNMQIITVTSGMAAIEALRNKDYHIVFMDHMMPEMDGVEATMIIRKQEAEYFKKLPIVALTANAVNGAREMFLAAGFNDFIAKPIEISYLDRVLRRWLPSNLRVSVTDNADFDNTEATIDVKESEEFKKLFNSEKGLLYAGGNQNTYFENLKVNFGNSKYYSESLDKRFKAQDWANYVIEAHAMKSSALSIGAEELSEQAKLLEFAGKAENYEFIRNKHEAFLRMYEKVMSVAAEYLMDNEQMEPEPEKEVQKPSLTEITADEFEKYIQAIKEACDNFDGEKIEACADLLCGSAFNGIELDSYFRQVKVLAEDFEYEKALETVEKAISDIKGGNL